MKTEHTPSPWHVAYYGETERAVIKHGSDSIAQVEYADDGNSNRITHANARLLAAAPDMLAVAKMVIDGRDWRSIERAAKAAINKVNGPKYEN